MDVNDTNSTQESSFIGGPGASYERYNRNGHWYDREKWADVLREGSHNMQLVEKKIVTELKTPYYIYDYQTVEYARGYYHAPVDGQYRFSCVIDDTLIFYLSEFKNNANPKNLKEILKQENWGNSLFSPFVRQNQTRTTQSVELTAGYYYF